MARVTNDVSYKAIRRLADWQFSEDKLRGALADLVNGISRCDAAEVWGHARTSSSDGQRYLFPRKTLKATYSHRLGDYALEFYTFVADNYAPFYSTPIECTERDAAYVLDGLSSTTSPRSILRSIKGSAHIRVEIQHKDPFLSGPGHDRGRTGRRE